MLPPSAVEAPCTSTALPLLPADQPDVAAVRVGEPELLVRPVVVGPLHDRRAVGGGAVGHVEDLARVPRLEPVVAAAGVHELPLLVRAVVAGPLADPRAVVGGRGVQVQRLAAVAVHQDVPGAGVHGRRRRGRRVHRDERAGRMTAAAAAASPDRQRRLGGEAGRASSMAFMVHSFDRGHPRAEAARALACVPASGGGVSTSGCVRAICGHGARPLAAPAPPRRKVADGPPRAGRHPVPTAWRSSSRCGPAATAGWCRSSRSTGRRCRRRRWRRPAPRRPCRCCGRSAARTRRSSGC